MTFGNEPAAPKGVGTSVFRFSEHGSYYVVLKQMVEFIQQGEFDVVHPNTSSTAYRAIALLGPQRPVAVGGCRGDNPHDYACNTEFADYLDHIFAISSRCFEGLRSGLAGKNVGVSVIHNSTRMAPRQPEKPRIGKLHIAYAGRLDVGKRVEDAIYAAKLLRDAGVDFTFSIAGEGPKHSELIQMVAGYRLGENVRFLGTLSLPEVGELMDSAHLNLLLSESEGFGLSIVDGMSRGAVPIVSEVCGCAEIISEGEDGFIVKLGDTKAIASLVQQLASKREQLTNLSQKAYLTFLERLTPEKELDAHLGVMRLAQEHHQLWAKRTPRWKYDGGALLDQRWVPDWLARSLRGLKYGRRQQGAGSS